MPRFIAVIAVVLTAAGPVWGETRDSEIPEHHEDFFALWNACFPVALKVHVGVDGRIEITQGAVERAARSRLRAARLYDDSKTLPLRWLNISVVTTGLAFSARVEFVKIVRDLGEHDFTTGFAPTWQTGSYGTGNAGFIMSALAEHIDEFIDEYLRVNAEACEAKAMSAPQ